MPSDRHNYDKRAACVLTGMHWGWRRTQLFTCMARLTRKHGTVVEGSSRGMVARARVSCVTERGEFGLSDTIRVVCFDSYGWRGLGAQDG